LSSRVMKIIWPGKMVILICTNGDLTNIGNIYIYHDLSESTNMVKFWQYGAIRHGVWPGISVGFSCRFTRSKHRQWNIPPVCSERLLGRSLLGSSWLLVFMVGISLYFVACFGIGLSMIILI
jgi:hypothetical protein